MKKLLTLLSMAMCFFAACQQVDIAEPVEPADSEKVMINIAVDGSESDEAETKSVVTISDSGIKNVSLFIFCNGSFSEAIYGTVTNGTLNMTSTKGYASNSRIDVFGLANVGNVTSNATLCSDRIASYSYTLASTLGINSNGFPMVGRVESAPIGTPFTMHLVRLTAKYGFKFVKNLNHGQFQITSLKLLNSPKVVYPFQEKSKVSSTAQIFPNTGSLMDLASSTNLIALNRGNAVPFYVLENCQGTLLPGNTDPWAKIPSNIGSPYKDLCTYIEVKGTYTDDSGGLTATHTYRMYLGQDNVTNFDVIRNTAFTYTLALSDDGFLKANWKAERTVNSDTRSLAFDKSTYEVKSGSNCDVSLTYNPDYFDCSFSLSQNLINAGVSFDTSYMALKQSKELTADVTGTLTATSWDGKITASCNVVAKKHQDDVIIEIKPESTALRMTSPYTPFDIDLKIDGVQKSLSYDGYELTSSNENVISTSLQEDWELLATGPGTATVTADYMHNGVSYKSSKTITVTEDRTISVTTNQTYANANTAFPVNLRPNFYATGTDTYITVQSDDPYLSFSTTSNGTYQTSLPGISVGKNSTKTIYAKYYKNASSVPKIQAIIPKTTVSNSVTITIKPAETYLKLYVTDEDLSERITDMAWDEFDSEIGFAYYQSGNAVPYNDEYNTPSGMYFFDGSYDPYFIGTATQWQNFLNIARDDDSYSGAGWVDGEYDSILVGPTYDSRDTEDYCYVGNSNLWETIEYMIENNCDAEIDLFGSGGGGGIIVPPTDRPGDPDPKPTKTFYLWPSKAYIKSEEDKENNHAYVKFTTNDLYWKHKINIELAFPNADWAGEPFWYGPGTNGIFQIDNLKWDYEIGGIEMQISDDINFSVVGTYPERMWISAVYGLSSSQYEIEETYETVTGFSGPYLCRRSVTIEESDCIYKYVIQF